MLTLAIWGEVTSGAILTKCGVWGDMLDVCNISWLSVKGCGCGERGNFTFSHWLVVSPLQHWWLPCDRVIIIIISIIIIFSDINVHFY